MWKHKALGKQSCFFVKQLGSVIRIWALLSFSIPWLFPISEDHVWKKQRGSYLVLGGFLSHTSNSVLFFLKSFYKRAGQLPNLVLRRPWWTVGLWIGISEANNRPAFLFVPQLQIQVLDLLFRKRRCHFLSNFPGGGKEETSSGTRAAPKANFRRRRKLI